MPVSIKVIIVDQWNDAMVQNGDVSNIDSLILRNVDKQTQTKISKKYGFYVETLLCEKGIGANRVGDYLLERDEGEYGKKA